MTLADVGGFIAWSKRHAQGQLEDEVTDDLIREHVHSAMQDGELANGGDDAPVGELVDLVTETLVAHQVSTRHSL